MIWNYFKNKKKKVEALKMSKRAFRDMLDSFKENKDHPCPDYGLKRSLEKCSFRYARMALQDSDLLPTIVVSGLNMIVDYERLEKQGRPVPMEFFKNEIEMAYDTVKNV